MTPAQQQLEAERASILFHAALVQMGAKSVEDALALWDDVPPVPVSQSSRAVSRWLSTLVRYVLRRRIKARDLAIAYYRYQRAIYTGSTIAIPGRQEPRTYTLPQLREEFESLIDPALAPEAPAPVDLDDEEISVEQVPGLNEELAKLEKEAEQEAKVAFEAVGPTSMDRKLRKVENDDAAREEAHTQAGRRQAASAGRESMNGARGSLFLLGDRDTKVIGFARVSRTGTPCGFCAMLISRGFTEKSGLYRSSQGSSLNTPYGDLDLYHDNCQCYAVPIFSTEQLNGDLFATNREYADLWPKVTKGLNGKDALAAWRAYFRQQQAQSQKSLEAAA